MGFIVYSKREEVPHWGGTAACCCAGCVSLLLFGLH